MAKLLSPTNLGPTIVLQTPKLIYFNSQMVADEIIGEGDFGCCEMDHKLKLADGTILDITCDKVGAQHVHPVQVLTNSFSIFNSICEALTGSRGCPPRETYACQSPSGEQPSRV